MARPRQEDNHSARGSDVRDTAKFIDKVLADALVAFQTSSSEKISATTRKRRQEKSLIDLATAQERMDHVVSHINQMEETFEASERKRKAAEEGRSEMLERVEDLVHQSEISVSKIRETQAAKLAAEKECRALSQKVEALETENLALSQSIEKCDSGTPKAPTDIVLREEHDHELRERHACLSQEFAAKREELQRWKVAFEDSQRKVASHVETYRRQNAVIAKLTADNIMQMIQLKNQETSSRQYRTDFEAMKQEIETKRSQWFDEIRSTVASQLKESFEKCEELRQEMQMVRRDYEHRLTLQAEEHREREEQIQRLVEEGAKLEEQRVSAEERGNKSREEVAALREDLQKCETRLSEMRTEWKVTSDAANASREELSAMRLKNRDIENAVRRRDEELEALRRINERLEGEQQRCTEMLQQQQRVNSELMKRKEQVEWDLVEARASQVA